MFIEYLIHLQVSVSERFTDKIIMTALFKHKNRAIICRHLNNIKKSFSDQKYNVESSIINVNIKNQKPKTI